MKKLFLIGAGGHCASCIDVIQAEGRFQIEGIFDRSERVGEEVLGYKIIAEDMDIPKYINSDHYFLITLGQIKTAEKRVALYEQLKKAGASLATVISPRAYVAKSALIGAGTIVLHDALVNSRARVGENCILNTKSLIEHDAVVEDHCHISTAAILNGGALISAGSFLGSNAVVREAGFIPSNSVVSAGIFVKERRP